MKKSTQEETKRHNSRLVLRTIYSQGQVSRVDVSRQTRLTRTTVSDIVAKFIEDGLVVETGTSPSRGGKPAILLSVADDSHHLVGIDLANSEFHGAIVNLRGQVRGRVDLPVQDQDGEAALALVYSLIQDLLALTSRPVLGIGIGAPGLMDPQQGVVLQAVNLDWFNLPLGSLLKERFQLPIYIANDSQAAALGEYTFGEHKGQENLVVVKVGRGLGAGIVLDGKLFHGDNSGAGEIGHVQVVENGEPCRCGNRGCLETVVSSRALVRRARQVASAQPASIFNQLVRYPQEITTQVVLKACQMGDAQALALVEDAGRYLGIALSHLTSVLNINRIVLAGSLSRFGDALAGPVRQRLRQAVLPSLASQTQVAISSLGSDIVILGAASLLLSQELGLA